MILKNTNTAIVVYWMYALSQIVKWGSWLLVAETVYLLISFEPFTDTPYILMVVLSLIYATQCEGFEGMTREQEQYFWHMVKVRFMTPFKLFGATFCLLNLFGLMPIYLKALGVE